MRDDEPDELSTASLQPCRPAGKHRLQKAAPGGGAELKPKELASSIGPATAHGAPCRPIGVLLRRVGLVNPFRPGQVNIMLRPLVDLRDCPLRADGRHELDMREPGFCLFSGLSGLMCRCWVRGSQLCPSPLAWLTRVSRGVCKGERDGQLRPAPRLAQPCCPCQGGPWRRRCQSPWVYLSMARDDHVPSSCMTAIGMPLTARSTSAAPPRPSRGRQFPGPRRQGPGGISGSRLWTGCLLPRRGTPVAVLCSGRSRTTRPGETTMSPTLAAATSISRSMNQTATTNTSAE